MSDGDVVLPRPISGNFEVTMEPSGFDRIREMFNLDGSMPTVHISGVPGVEAGDFRVVDFREHADGSFTLDLREA